MCEKEFAFTCECAVTWLALTWSSGQSSAQNLNKDYNECAVIWMSVTWSRGNSSTQNNKDFYA